MGCVRMDLPGGGTAIVCGVRSRSCSSCGRTADFLCDWKVEGNKSGTCDRAICSVHAKQVAPEKHLCPEHQRAHADWQRRRATQELDPNSSGRQATLFP